MLAGPAAGHDARRNLSLSSVRDPPNAWMAVGDAFQAGAPELDDLSACSPGGRPYARLRRCRTGRPTPWAADAHAHLVCRGRSGRGRSMMLGPHVRGGITLLL